MMNDETRNVKKGQRIGLISPDFGPAGLGVRLAAGVMDILVICILNTSAEFFLSGLMSRRIYFYLVLPTVYYALSYCFFSTTLGKRMYNLRLTQVDSTVPGLLNIIIRIICWYISIASVGLGYLLLYTDSRKMALHDRMSKTCVIKTVETRHLEVGYITVIMTALILLSSPLDPHPADVPWIDLANLLGRSSSIRITPRLARIQSDIHAIALALQEYRIDHGEYPPASHGDTWDPVIPDASQSASIGYVPLSITTPIAYLQELPVDGCNTKARKNLNAPKTFMYRYATAPGKGFIVVSNGPDLNPDFDLSVYLDEDGANGEIAKYLIQYGGRWAEYDPTNGAASSGDLYRTGP